MLAPEHEAVLNAMAPTPARWWYSRELKDVVLGRFPEIHERKARRTLEALEEMRWIEREGRGPAVPVSVAFALALFKLRQLAKHHLPQQMGEERSARGGAS